MLKQPNTTHIDHDGHECYFDWIPVDELTILKDLQRSPRKTKINEIANDYREDCAGALIVARMKDEDGDAVYHVCDGQHRLMAVRKAIEEKKIDANIKLPCLIYTNLDKDECMSVTIACNKVRATLPANDLFAMQLAMDDPFTVFINDMIERYGFTTHKDEDTRPCDLIVGSNLIRPYVNIKKDLPFDYYENDQRVTPYVHMTLNLLSQLWDGDKNRVRTQVFRGFFYFFKEYAKYIIDTGITEKELLNAFSHTTPSKIVDIGNRIKMFSLASNTESGSNINQDRTRRLAVLAALMMTYRYDYSAFMPSSKVNSTNGISDLTVVNRFENDGIAEPREFVKKGKMKPLKRDPGHGYGYNYFEHEEEEQDE